MIEAARSRQSTTSAGDDFAVHCDNWDSLLFFLQTSATQWNVVAGLEGLYYIGLRHESFERDMKLYGIKRRNRPALYADLLIIERAALKVLNKVKD